MRIERAALPFSVVDIAPIEGHAPTYLALGTDGRLAHFDGRSGQSVVLAGAALPKEPQESHRREPRPRLHVSSDGAFAAVVNDFGNRGQVIDLASGRVTLALECEDYHSDTVPFSLAFFVHGDRPLVIHRTAWNRLDVSDPSTGRLLTERGPTRYGPGEDRPPHYLDYFHGALSVSPNGQHVIDDGWVWQPLRVVAVWSLARWLTENLWESEDGPTRTDFGGWGDWGTGMTWIDDEVAAFCDVDETEPNSAPRACLVSVQSTAMRAIEGPNGKYFGDGATLYAADRNGLSAWNVATGECTAQFPEARPTHQHRAARELAWVEGETLVRFIVQDRT